MKFSKKGQKHVDVRRREWIQESGKTDIRFISENAGTLQIGSPPSIKEHDHEPL
jgi:hypothetical protein